MAQLATPSKSSKPVKATTCMIWLKFILAVVPSIVFGVFTVVFTIQQNSLSKSTLALEQHQALQQRIQSIFENCIDVITNVLITTNFNRSNAEHLGPIREKVTSALRHLDAVHKRDVIYFLYSNKLIRNDIPIEQRLDLSGADLHMVQFITSDTMDCNLRHLYLRGVKMFDVVFSDCDLHNADFTSSIMNRTQFQNCYLEFSSFSNADLTNTKFVNNRLYTLNFSGASLVQASFVNNSVFVNTDWTNTNLFQSNINDQDLFGIMPSGSTTTTIVNSRFRNGSFLIDTSNLIIDGGAEEMCDAPNFDWPSHWYNTAKEVQMSVHKYMENSSMYYEAVEGICYFIGKNVSAVSQDIHVHRFSKLIDNGQASLNMSIQFGCTPNQLDEEAIMSVMYLDKRDQPIFSSQPTLRTKKEPFEYQSMIAPIPVGTRIIKVYLAAGIPNISAENILQYCAFDAVKLFVFDRNSAS